MTAKTLTKAQRAMLERLAAGTFIHALYGLNATAFYAGGSIDTAPLNTVQALLTRKLIDQRGDHGKCEHHITELGRAALSKSPDEGAGR